MTAKTENLKEIDEIKRKDVGNARNRTHQNICRATLILPMKVTINVRDSIIRRVIGIRTV